MKKHAAHLSPFWLVLATILIGLAWRFGAMAQTEAPASIPRIHGLCHAAAPPPAITPPPQCCPDGGPDSGAPLAPATGSTGTSDAATSTGTSSSCSFCSTSPVLAANGNYFTSATDIALPSVSGPLWAVRRYDSARPVDGLSGVGWSSSLTVQLFYAVYLVSLPSTYERHAYVILEDGYRAELVENADGVTYTNTGTRHDTLMHNGDGTFDLTLQGTRRTYHFGSNGAPLTCTDESGNVRTYTYDGTGRLQRVADTAGSGRYLDLFYGADGRISIVRDSANRQVQYFYDSNGLLTSVIDPASRTTTYGYVSTQNGTLLSTITDSFGRNVATVTYDTSARLSHLLDAEGGRTYNYTPSASQTSTTLDWATDYGWIYTYNAIGQIVNKEPHNSLGGFSPVTHTDFNPDGSVALETDPVGVKTAYTYDSLGRVASVTRDSQGPLAIRFDYAYDPAFPDRVISTTADDPATGSRNPDWQSWQYDYYQAGAPSPGRPFHLYRVKSDGTTETLSTYVYDSHGRMTRTTNATGNATDYVYDSVGNLWTVTKPANNDVGTRPVTTYLYDAMGRVTSVSDPLGHATTYGYDAVDRVTSVTLPKPSIGSALVFTTAYTYDNYDGTTGLTFINVTDPNGTVTKQGYDQWGRLIRSVDGLGHVTAYGYTNGFLTSITDANGNVTTYVYDTVRRWLTQTTFPDGSTETYQTNFDGTMNTVTRNGFGWTTYVYDNLKRVSTRTLSAGPGDTYSYIGQKLTGITSVFFGTTDNHVYQYDPSYRLISEQQGTRGTVAHTYNADDAVATMTVQGGPSTTYAYYPDGSLDTIQWSLVGGLFKYQYTLPGQYQSIAFPNGATRNFSYDDQGRLAQLSNLDPIAGNLATYAYGYDLNYTTGQNTMLGQRVSMTATVPSQNLNNHLFKYEYDPLYQLNKATYPNVAPLNGEVDSWTYDGIGNRLTNTVNGTTTAYGYQKITGNPNNWQRLLSDGAKTYGYDLAGNATSRTGPDGSFIFTWWANGQMREIWQGGTMIASYGYDALARRSSKTVNSAVTNYLYDRQNLIQEQGGSPADYLFGPGIDEPLSMHRGGQTYNYETDSLGSVGAVSNASGVVQDSYLYDAWGQIRSQTGTLPNPFTYTARETGEIGLDFYRARYYQPPIGRFSSEDLIREVDTEYAYGANSPVVAFDPTGMAAVTPGSQTVFVCCRPAQDPRAGGLLHCYIYLRHIHLELEPHPPSLFSTGYVEWNAGDFDPDSDCAFTRECKDCVDKAAKDYPSPTPYNALGKNSNTFVGTVARKCGLNIPASATRAPGWDRDAPPSPTPTASPK